MNTSIQRMFATFMLALLITVALVFHVHAATPPGSDFVKKASVANEFEIESSQLALKRSQNDAVKQFAQQMIDDHTKAGSDLTAVVNASNGQLPQPATELDSKHQKIFDKLNAADGAAFDKAYVDAQVDGHKEAKSLFHDYAKHGDNPALKSFAASTEPVITEHLDHVKQLKASIKS